MHGKRMNSKPFFINLSLLFRRSYFFLGILREIPKPLARGCQAALDPPCLDHPCSSKENTFDLPPASITVGFRVFFVGRPQKHRVSNAASANVPVDAVIVEKRLPSTLYTKITVMSLDDTLTIISSFICQI
jgi:hypothetical protein